MSVGSRDAPQKRKRGPVEHPVRQCFLINETNRTATCMEIGCQVVLLGPHTGNMMRHMLTNHKPFHDELKAIYERMKKKRTMDTTKKPTLNIAIDLEDLKRAMLATIIEDGRPFEALDDKGFQCLARPICEALNRHHGHQFTVSAETGRELTLKRAEEVRQLLKKELKGRYLSLKVDGVSRLGRCFLGIHVQFIKDGKLCLRTLAMPEITTKHTSEELRKLIVESLGSYEIPLNKIFSANIDNGSHMEKAAELVKELQERGIISHEEEKSEFSSFFKLDMEECFKLFDADTDASISYAFPNIVHILPLAVCDFLTSADLQVHLNQFRIEVEKLQTNQSTCLLRKLHATAPCLDAPTQWSSTLDMLESLLKLRPHSKELSVGLSHEEWEVVRNIFVVLQPVQEITKILESEQLLIGDFLINWLKMKFALQKLTSKFALALLKAIEGREQHPSRKSYKVLPLFENPAVLAAAYLDPRIFLSLSLEQIGKAEAAIRTLWAKLKGERISCEDSESNHSADVSNSESEEDIDEFERHMRATDRARGVPRLGARQSLNSQLEGLEWEFYSYKRDVRRLDRKADVLQWWKTREGFEWPSLSECSDVVLTSPASQISVHRVFSNIKFMSTYRHNLKPDTAQAILLIRSNMNVWRRSAAAVSENSTSSDRLQSLPSSSSQNDASSKSDTNSVTSYLPAFSVKSEVL